MTDNVTRASRHVYSPSQKFIDLVENTDGLNGNNKPIKRIRFVKEDVKEIIQLRHKINDKKYQLVPYNDTPKTIRMRHRLNQYNDFMSSLKALTILTLTRKELREMKPGHAETFNNMLLNGSIVFCDRKMRTGSKVVREVNKSPVDTTSSLENLMLEQLRSHFSIVFHIFQVAGRLLHFYERHLYDIGFKDVYKNISVSLSDLIDPDVLLDRAVNFCLFYAWRVLSTGKDLASRILNENMETSIIEVGIPKDRGFHSRPSLLVAKIVQHYGGEVKMVVNNDIFDRKRVPSLPPLTNS